MKNKQTENLLFHYGNINKKIKLITDVGSKSIRTVDRQPKRRRVGLLLEKSNTKHKRPRIESSSEDEAPSILRGGKIRQK